MGFSFTKDQQKVIDVRDCNVLVSAAAGSGKTAVLVERIIALITDENHPIDVDRLLIVTFTNAAAAEMRERIHHAIMQKLEENPFNEHLQMQATLVHGALITTIHSFCLYLLRNHFYEIDIDPAFRVIDEGERKLIRKNAINNVLENEYAKKEESFLKCVEYFEKKGRDLELENYLLELETYACSHPFPKEFLMNAYEELRVTSVDELLQTKDYKEVMKIYQKTISEILVAYEVGIRITNDSDGPYCYGDLFEEEFKYFETLMSVTDYETATKQLQTYVFARLPSKKDSSVSEEKKEFAKKIRDGIKEKVNFLKSQYFFSSLDESLEHTKATQKLAETLSRLTFSFMDEYAAMKREKNAIDFSDMEHLALGLLIDPDSKLLTTTAKQYQELFYEVMTDEYQDSNLVQELLLSAVSKETGNRFMVGDVKQSIYKFRLARPELFLEKYHSYPIGDKVFDGKSTNERIDLSKNFRSRGEVISFVNAVFEKVMISEIGGVSYDEAARLALGADYPTNDLEENSFQSELLCYETKDEEHSDNSVDVWEFGEMSKKYAHAIMVANKIEETIGTFLVTDKETKSLRPAKYKDIVILVRSTQSYEQEFKAIFSKRGIPLYMESQKGYFNTSEVRMLLEFLKILDNPLQDIALAAVLTSVFFDFTPQELASIRINTSKKSLYESIVEYSVEHPEHPKVRLFLDTLNEYRHKMMYQNIHQLLEELCLQFSYKTYVASMPGGENREANVEMLLEKALDFEKSSFRGVFQFVRYMEQLEKYEVDFGEASLVDEYADTVRMMTIHKSKGLEFPICFVVGLETKFNRADSKKAIVVDVDRGIAATYIDASRRIKSATIRKNLFLSKMQVDALGEELRILYVALTRAKEKLFLTACVADLSKELQKSCEKTVLSGKNGYLENIQQARSYLDFILPTVDVENDKLICISYYNEEKLAYESFETGLERAYLKQSLKELLNQDLNSNRADSFKKQMFFEYPHKILEQLYVKTSVSELKKAKGIELEDHYELFETVQKKDGVLGTTRGSAYHKMMELLDFKEFYEVLNLEKANQIYVEQTQELKKHAKISQEYVNLVDQNKILSFLVSPIGQRVCKAHKESLLFREKQFILALPANELNSEFPDTEHVLIQGIIDVYFEEEGEYVLLDYKTDQVDTKESLVKKYSIQLDYYARALEQLKRKKVKSKILYSFYFGEAVE